MPGMNSFSPNQVPNALALARTTVTAETRVVRVEGGEANLNLALPPNGVVLVLVGQTADE